jgi:dTDP-4-amino-4,6-dideoxygalactose transaminase
LSHSDSAKAELRLDNTEIASKSVLSLPVHPLLEEEDIDRISHSLKKAIKIDK